MADTNTSAFGKKDDNLLLLDEEEAIDDLTEKFNSA